MSVDLNEVLEGTSAPPMGIDPYAVVHGGRRRVRRRRLTAVASGTAVVAAIGVAAAVADGPGTAPLTPVASARTSASPDALLRAPSTLEFTQRGADGVVRSYRVTVSPDRGLDRNQAVLEVLEPGGGATLIGAIAMTHPERGPVAGEDVPARGTTWSLDRTASGHTRMNTALQDGTEFSVPLRHIPATPFTVAVLDGLSTVQVGQTMSSSNDNGIPALR
ncbi:hypothetical protein [Phycicoccus sp. Root101]|uniref:hypothetical protein n=1 Tax=Phycicoccus sp. Root101 TaxID=1736421 RepID=UPI0007029C50|nr:hypothetical protein [Phycicoccus sp. Root101]KQU70819.1 hypothetical protein ASC58_03330 [Phycicoccus sp. Root101]